MYADSRRKKESRAPVRSASELLTRHPFEQGEIDISNDNSESQMRKRNVSSTELSQVRRNSTGDVSNNSTRVKDRSSLRERSASGRDRSASGRDRSDSDSGLGYSDDERAKSGGCFYFLFGRKRRSRRRSETMNSSRQSNAANNTKLMMAERAAARNTAAIAKPAPTQSDANRKGVSHVSITKKPSHDLSCISEITVSFDEVDAAIVATTSSSSSTASSRQDAPNPVPAPSQRPMKEPSPLVHSRKEAPIASSREASPSVQFRKESPAALPFRKEPSVQFSSDAATTRRSTSLAYSEDDLYCSESEYGEEYRSMAHSKKNASGFTARNSSPGQYSRFESSNPRALQNQDDGSTVFNFYCESDCGSEMIRPSQLNRGGYVDARTSLQACMEEEEDCTPSRMPMTRRDPTSTYVSMGSASATTSPMVQERKSAMRGSSMKGPVAFSLAPSSHDQTINFNVAEETSRIRSASFSTSRLNNGVPAYYPEQFHESHLSDREYSTQDNNMQSMIGDVYPEEDYDDYDAIEIPQKTSIRSASSRDLYTSDYNSATHAEPMQRSYDEVRPQQSVKNTETKSRRSSSFSHAKESVQSVDGQKSLARWREEMLLLASSSPKHRQRKSSVESSDATPAEQTRLRASSFSSSTMPSVPQAPREHSLANAEDAMQLFSDSAILGHASMSGWSSAPIHLNTAEPFCLITVGDENTGHADTFASIIESCVIPFAYDDTVRLANPMSALVLRYDRNLNSVSEAIGLIEPNVKSFYALRKKQGLPHLPREKLIVLVSPSYYKQRKAFYGDYCTVRPLLFRWKSLSPGQIRRIMGLTGSESNLFLKDLLELLRSYQRKKLVPSFDAFMKQVSYLYVVHRKLGPLGKHMRFLESVVAESSLNDDIRDESMDLSTACRPGMVVIADLTDPLMTGEAANGIFQVLVDQYRIQPMSCGKVVGLDDAHKYMDGVNSDGLSEIVAYTARTMQQTNVRVVISTHKPRVLAPELLDFVTVSVLHRFTSRSWFAYLSSKVALSEMDWNNIVGLQSNYGVVVSSNHCLGEVGSIIIRMRERLTSSIGRKNTELDAE